MNLFSSSNFFRFLYANFLTVIHKDTALDERYYNHEAHEGHEEFEYF